MRCLTAHRGDVYLAMRGPDSARVNSVSSPRRLRSLTTHRRPIPPHSPRSIPDFYQARDKPIPIGSYKRLPASSCIGNAPAINSTLLLSTTAPSHSRYNTNDIPGRNHWPEARSRCMMLRSRRTMQLKMFSGLMFSTACVLLYFGAGWLFVMPRFPGESYFTLERLVSGLGSTLLTADTSVGRMKVTGAPTGSSSGKTIRSSI